MISLKRQTDVEKFKVAVKESFSIAGVLKQLGVRVAGGNYQTVKKWVSQLNLDTSHWKGKGWLKGQVNIYSRSRELSELLVENIWLNTYQLKHRLIKQKILKEICDICSIGPVWQDKPLALHLDHINGKRNDQRIENLRLLCPNCHSQTDTYTGKNKNKTKVIQPASISNGRYGPIQREQKPIKIKLDKPRKFCIVCNSECKNKYCSQVCSHESQHKILWPNIGELTKLVWEQPLIKLSKQLGVTDNAIRHRCKINKIKLPEYGHWQRIHANMALSTTS